MKLILKIITAILTSLSAIMLFGAGFASTVGPSNFEVITLLGVYFEVLVFLNLAMIVLAGFFGKYFAILPIVAIAVAFPKPFDMVQFHPQQSVETADEEKSLKVLTYNVHLFNKHLHAKEEHLKDSIISFMNREDADVYFIQEFYHNPEKSSASTMGEILDQLGTPYYYLERERSVQQTDSYFYGLAVFSKYPITGKGDVVSYSGGKAQAVYADIKVNNQKVRAYNVHLQSMGFDDEEYEYLKRNHQLEIEQAFSDLDRKTDRFLASSKVRVSQTMAIEDHMRGCKYPIVIAGNFNETPNSFNTYSLSRYMQDGFFSQGSGMGFTLYPSQYAPPMRTDYIFASESLNFMQFETHGVDYSDHRPVSAMLTF